MLSIMLVALAAPAGPPHLAGQWAVFSRAGSLSHTTQTIAIAMDETDFRDHAKYVLRRVATAPRTKTEVRWTDSTTCPVVLSLVSGLRGMPMPSLSVPALPSSSPSPSPDDFPDGRSFITVDGSSYALTAPSSFAGTVTLTGGSSTPLAEWIDAALAKLERCWTTRTP